MEIVPMMSPRILAACFLALCGGCGGTGFAPDAALTPGSDGGTDAGPVLTAFQQALLTAHNRVRANAMPVPDPPLPVMRWSASAQTVAEEWASHCTFAHSTYPLGENLLASLSEASPATAVNEWAKESSDYTYATGQCVPGKMCGHYTQLVSRVSVGLGCTQRLCTSNNPFSPSTLPDGGPRPWFLFVCEYDPAGNIIGQKPY